MEKQGNLGNVGTYDIALANGKITLSVTENDALGSTSLVRTIDEKIFLDMLVAKMPSGWLKSAAEAAEAALLKV